MGYAHDEYDGIDKGMKNQFITLLGSKPIVMGRSQ